MELCFRYWQNVAKLRLELLHEKELRALKLSLSSNEEKTSAAALLFAECTDTNSSFDGWDTFLLSNSQKHGQMK